MKSPVPFLPDTAGDISTRTLLYHYFPLLRNAGVFGKAGKASPESVWEMLKQAACSRPDNATAFIRKHSVSEHPDLLLILPLLEGIAAHLLWRRGYGEMPGGKSPDSLPDALSLSDFLKQAAVSFSVLQENSRTYAEIIKGCIPHIRDDTEAEKYLSDFLRLVSHPDPELSNTGEDTADEANAPEIISQKSVRSRAAEGIILLALHLKEKGIPFPRLLPSLLLRFATDSHPAVRLSLLPYLNAYAAHDSPAAWRIFHALYCSSADTLPFLRYRIELFLQQQCGENFLQVRYYLKQTMHRNLQPDTVSWGNILAENFLNQKISQNEMCEMIALFREIKAREYVFAFLVSAILKHEKHSAKALQGIQALLRAFGFTEIIFKETENLFRGCQRHEILVPLFYIFLSEFRGMSAACDLSFLYETLSDISAEKPLAALPLCHELLGKIRTSQKQFCIWQGEKCIAVIRRILQDKRMKETELTEISAYAEKFSKASG